MGHGPLIRRYRSWYAKLLRFYPKPYYEHFSEGMEQAFIDLCREQVQVGKGLFGFVLWMFAETSAGIIKENLNFILMQRTIKRLGVWVIVVAAVLMIPLLAKFPWSSSDFIIGGAVLFGFATLYELITMKLKTRKSRIIAGVVVFVVLLYVWAELAVGIFTNWGS